MIRNSTSCGQLSDCTTKFETERERSKEDFVQLADKLRGLNKWLDSASSRMLISTNGNKYLLLFLQA